MRVVVLVGLLGMIAQGAETVGWRVPLDWVIPTYTREGVVQLMDTPPGPSAFFENGDQLIDVRAALNNMLSAGGGGIDPFASPGNPSGKAYEGDWVVWNKRSKILVARGSWEDLELIHRYVEGREMPLIIRSEISIQSAHGGQESYVLLSRSGDEVEKVVDDSLVRIKAQLGPNSRDVDAWVFIRQSLQGNHAFEVDTSLCLQVGMPTVLAAWNQKDGMDWQVSYSANPLTLDATPLDEVLWIEKSGRLESFLDEKPFEKRQVTKSNLRDGMRVERYNVPPDFDLVLGDSSAEQEGEGDPFAVGETTERERRLRLLDVPEELFEAGVGGIDITDLLRAEGVNFSHPLAMAGYLRSSSTIVMVNDEVNHDLLEFIVMGGGYEPPRHILTQTKWHDGSAQLRSASGTLSKIVVFAGEDVVSSMEISACIGANDLLLDVGYRLEPLRGDVWKGSLTLLTGHPTEIGTRTSAGDRMSVALEAQVMPKLQKEDQ